MQKHMKTGVLLICTAGIYLFLHCLFSGGWAFLTAAYTYERMQRELETLQKMYPDTLQVEVIGYTHENRPIYAARAGDPAAGHHVLIQASIHAREHMTSLLAMRQLNRLLCRGVPKDVLVHILPMTNPDGVTISQKGQVTPELGAIYERDRSLGYTTQPIQSYLRTWKANAAGVDLNRNFDAQWQRIDTRPEPSFSNYRGSMPESEPETRALVDYARRYPFEATLSSHATGSEIYYDFGNHPSVNEAGLRLAVAVAAKTGYKLVPDDDTSFGGFKDWAIERLHIPSLTVEVGKHATPLPAYEFFSVWKENKDVPFVLIDFIK